MSRAAIFVLFYCAVFLQAGAYGLTFMLPNLFEAFGANEKVVGAMLSITAVATLLVVYFSGHISDWFGRTATLGYACIAIAISLYLFSLADSVDIKLIVASILLGGGWGLTYSLIPVVLTTLVHRHERVRYFAGYSVFLMAGFGLPPIIAGYFDTAGIALQKVFVLSSAATVFGGIIFFALIKPVRANRVKTGDESQSRLTLSNIVEISRTKAIVPLIMVFLGASVFAGMNNFQTVFASERGLDYSIFFLVYTLTVVILRVVVARFSGGNSPYLTIAMLQYVMFASVFLFLFSGDDPAFYILVALLFGIGYGVSYPILAAMAANDADETLVPQTLQLFALSYFVGIFGFPLVAGWTIVELGSHWLLWLVAQMAFVEASMALRRSFRS